MAPRLGVPTPRRVRLLQGPRTGCLRGAGRAEPHVPTLFSDGLWVHARRQPPRRTLRVPEVRVRSERGLQRGEEHRATVRSEATTQTPFLAQVGERRRTSRRAYNWWDVER